MGRPRLTKAERQLDELAHRLEDDREDPLRIELIRCTQRFKRSWVELAEALLRVREDRGFERWGYPNLHDYCAQELQLKAATVDKLVLSFTTLQRHAPRMLQRADADCSIPSYQAIHYYARAVDDAQEDRLPQVDPATRDETLQALHHAVFDEGQSVVMLRKQFDPVLRPKPPEQATLEALHKLKAASLKVSEMLLQADGLEQARIDQVEGALQALREDVETLTAPLRKNREQRRAIEPLVPVSVPQGRA